MPADCRDALEWFVSSYGLYQGSLRGLFLSDFDPEHEASLEASIINLRSRSFSPYVVNGETLYKQADFLWEQSREKTTFGRPLASKLELDLTGSDIVILKDLNAPENERHLWYLHKHVIYPRALSGKALVITTTLAYEEFLRYGATCPDYEFGGRTITWEKLFWLLEACTINLELFRLMREEGLPPLLKAEYYLWMSLRERGLNAVPQHVLGDYMLDLALVNKEQRLDIEVDGLTAVGGQERQAEEAKRNLVLLADGWQILRFTTAEILNNHAGCAEVVEDVWRNGRKRLPLGRLLTGQTVAEIPELPVDDDAQLAAITHGGGPAAVIGGPGTGKTTCVIYRVAYLIAQGISPESILVLSFSPETLESIRTGLEAILERQALQRLNLWTWHDFGLKILKENLSLIKRKPPLKVEPNPQKIIQRLLNKYKKDLDQMTLELSTGLDEFTIAAAIAIYKANLVSSKEVKERAADEMDGLIARVYQGYEEQLQRANRIDREDMVTLAAQLLLERPEVRAKYQCRFDFVLVDEYQDVNAAQDMMARLLASPQDNLFIAGDEDEAIYEAKGASPRFLTDVSHRVPQTRCYYLERNWRSNPQIVDHARQLASGLTRRRVNKEMLPAWESASGTAIVGPQQLPGEKEEADWVASEIQILVDSGRSLGDIAVLYRYHRYGAILEESLARRGVRCLASHPEAGLVPDEAEDMMAYLKLVMDPDGPRAKEAFERVCQLRSREVDPKLSSTIASFAEANNLSYLKAVEIYSEATADQSCRELEQLVRIIRTMHQENLPPAETISLIRRTQRLNDYYRSVSVPPGVNYEPLRKLTLLEEEARKFQTVAEFVKHQTWLRQQQSGAAQADSGVHVLSLHESKGKQFAVVFLVGLAEGLFPAENANDLEEERRLCYVGLTRAREMVYLSWPGTFNGVALQPSSFLVGARLVSATAQHVPPAAPPQAVQQTRPAQPQPLPSAGVAVDAAPAAPPPARQAAPPEAPPPVAPPQTPPPKVAAALPPSPPVAPPAAASSWPVQAAPATAFPTAAAPAQASGPTAPVPPSQDVPAASPAPTTPVVQHAGYPSHEPAQDEAAPQPAPGTYQALPAQPPTEVYAPLEAVPRPVSPATTQPACPSCSHPLEAGARFCGQCGYQLGVRIPACPLCSSPLEPSAKFCGECGARLYPIRPEKPLSPGGLPMPGASRQRNQHGWLVKLLKFLEPD
ncbi:MAG TPA: UvrD-helicase domain-containing protein [Candidatus Obscuribacterales bacterium]